MRRLAWFAILLPACRVAASGEPVATPTAPVETPPPPAPLACLSRLYAGEPIRDASGTWSLRLPSGAALAYDDGLTKAFEKTLDAPDLEDVFSIPYRTGKIEPVTTPNHDPGRIRVDALFRETYGDSEKAVAAKIVTVTFLGKRLTVHEKVKPVFERLSARLEKAIAADPSLKPFLTGLAGTFNWRAIAGTDRSSSHSYGVSLDINVKRAHYWQWQKPPQPIAWKNEIPQAIVDAFEAEGFVWGGRWYHYDTMHFEYRPELLDASCYPP